MLKKIKNILMRIWKNKITILASFLLFIIGAVIAPSRGFDSDIFYAKFNEYNNNVKLLDQKEKEFNDLNTQIETLKSNVDDINKDVKERRDKLKTEELTKLDENN